MKTECDYLKGWIKSHKQKSHPKMVNPRDTAGNTEEEEEKEIPRYFLRRIPCEFCVSSFQFLLRSSSEVPVHDLSHGIGVPQSYWITG